MKGRYLVILVAMAGTALLAVALLRHEPSPARARTGTRAPEPPRAATPRPPQPPAVAVSERETARAMDETAVRGLVVNLKLAAMRRDEVTGRALIGGLKHHGSTARRVIEEERKTTQDSAVLTVLDAALKELP